MISGDCGWSIGDHVIVFDISAEDGQQISVVEYPLLFSW